MPHFFLSLLQPKADRPRRMAGVHFRRLERLFAQYRSKVEGCLELYFFGLSQRATWGASRSVWKGSRRLSGRNVFSGYISKGWSGFLLSIDPKSKAVWSCSFSGHRSGSLERFFEKDRPKAEGCLAGIFFRGTFPKAGVAFRRGSPKNWRRPGLNVFSEHNSEGRRGFPKRIDQKSKAVWNCTFSGHRSGPLGGALRSVWKGSRRQSGMNIFSRHISEG